MYRLVALALGLFATSPAFAQEESPKDEASFSLGLREAYQKEFAFLVSQKRELEKRLSTMDQRMQRDESKLQSEISGLETRILGLDSLLQDINMKVQESDQAAQSSSDEQQLVDATFDQARTSLKDYGVDIPYPKDEDGNDRSPSPSEVKAAFSAAIDTLERLGSITREDAEFFLEDGTKVQGKITYLGRVAAFGVSAKGAGALVPAGGGKLKLWKDDAAAEAKALDAGQRTKMLSMFIYESLDGRVDEEAEETIYKHVSDGGAIAWVIVMLGIFGVILAAARAAMLASASGGGDKVVEELSGPVRKGAFAAAADRARSLKGSSARVAASVFDSLKEGAGRVDEAISEGIIGESRYVQRFGTVILVIAAVSPLLGLLGTVTGMISTFDVITKFGTGDPKLLSGGISTALITTELGLIVAIPTLLLGSLLKQWADGIEAEAERTALRLVALAPGLETNRAQDEDEA